MQQYLGMYKNIGFRQPNIPFYKGLLNCNPYICWEDLPNLGLAQPSLQPIPSSCLLNALNANRYGYYGDVCFTSHDHWSMSTLLDKF